MAHSQVDPLPDLEGNEPRSLGDALKWFLNYYYFFKKIIIINNKEIVWERFAQTCIKMTSKEDSRRFLEYIGEQGAYTINVASSQLGIDSNKLYQYTVAFVNMGVLVKAGKLGKGSRGSPTLIYALRDAPQSMIDAAAVLYKDVTSSHVNSLDEYIEDYDYMLVAEEAVKRLEDGRVYRPALVRLLASRGMYGEKHQSGAIRAVAALGYEVTG